MISKFLSLIFTGLVCLVSFYRFGKDEAFSTLLELLPALLFIWFSNFIQSIFRNNFFGFLLFGRASSLEANHLKFFGWFLLVFLSFVIIFVPGYI